MLVATLLLVGGSTFLIGLLPTYSQVGSGRPVMLLGLRLLQGFGAGAEYGGAVVMAVEFRADGKTRPVRRFRADGTQVGNALAGGVFLAVGRMAKEKCWHGAGAFPS